MAKLNQDVLIPIYTSEKFLKRFWSRVNKKDDNVCWDWSPKPFVNGYGHIAVERDGVRHMVGCHRISYIIKNGRIPDGLVVMHSCDNRRCVNPAHLSVGTKHENMRQMWERGRGVTHSHPGDMNPASKLSSGHIEAILILRKSGWKMDDIARRYKVSQPAISALLRGKTWNAFKVRDAVKSCEWHQRTCAGEGCSLTHYNQSNTAQRSQAHSL